MWLGGSMTPFIRWTAIGARKGADHRRSLGIAGMLAADRKPSDCRAGWVGWTLIGPE
jgi:hypothetical protein